MHVRVILALKSHAGGVSIRDLLLRRGSNNDKSKRLSKSGGVSVQRAHPSVNLGTLGRLEGLEMTCDEGPQFARLV